MAEKIAEGAEDSERDIQVDLKSVEDTAVDSLLEYDGIIIGSPTYYGLPSAEVKKLIDESVSHHGELNGKVAGAFSSSANKGGGNETTIMALIGSLLIHGMVIKGDSNGDHYGPVVVGEPNDEDLQQCEDYGRMIADLTVKVS